MILLAETGALLKGHFRLQSGQHSEYFARIGQLLYRRADATEIATMMSEQLGRFRDHSHLVCLASENASGYLGRALAETLGARVALARIDECRRPTSALSSGEVSPGDSVLIVSDVVTTGQSIEPLLELVKERQATPIGIAALLVLDSKQWLSFLAQHELPGEGLLEALWDPVAAERCPQCARGEALLPGFEFN